MKELQEEGCCEHKNCYITFDIASKDEDLFTYFIIDEDESKEKLSQIDKTPWERAAEADVIYLFCKIHSDALINHFASTDTPASLSYLESIVKSPHFGDGYVR